MEKYGKEFALDAIENRDGKVAERVLKRLRVEPPAAELVNLYLREIARAYGVAWPKDEQTTANKDDHDHDEDDPSSGQAIKSLEEPLTTRELSRATPPRDFGPKSPVSIAPPSPSTDNLQPRIKLPRPPELKPTAKMNAQKQNEEVKRGDEGEMGSVSKKGDVVEKKNAVGGKIPDVDELAKRFAALKR